MRLFWADSDVFHFPLLMTKANADIFALLKPQL